MAIAPLLPTETPSSRRQAAFAAAGEAIDVLVEELRVMAATAHDDPDSLPMHEVRAAVAGAEQLARRAQAARDVSLAVAAAAEVDRRAGTKGVADWLSGVTGTDLRTASRHVRRSDDLDLGGGAGIVVGGGVSEGGPEAGSLDVGAASAPAPPTVVSPLRQALLDGSLSSAHVDVITATLASLPDGTADEVRADCEETLLRMARTRKPAQLRRDARRVLELATGDVAAADEHEHDQAVRQEDAAWEAASFWIKDNHDGTMHGQFTVPTLAGHVLKKVIDTMSSPRRKPSPNPRGTRPGVASEPMTGATWAGLTPRERALRNQQRRGQELATLLLHLPTDGLHGKTAATVIVTTSLAGLQDRLTRASALDNGEVLSAGDTRRLACGAGLMPAVLGSRSQVLDLGHQTRIFTDAQRTALALTYRECAADGCETPFAWCEAHHLTAWEDDGRTDLDNAVPLCGWHHRLIDRAAAHTIDVERPDPPPPPTGRRRQSRTTPPVRKVIRFRC